MPTASEDPRWTLVFDEPGELDRNVMDAHDSLLTVADGTIGVRGVREDDGEARQLRTARTRARAASTGSSTSSARRWQSAGEMRTC